MDLEAPADAWYVFIGVSLVSVAAAGVALGFPTGVGPDATNAMNQINEVAGSNYGTSATLDHDAEQFWVDSKRIALRNEHGTAHATVSFGTMAPVRGSDDLKDVLGGESVDDVFSDSGAFEDAVEAAQEDVHDDDGPEWYSANGQLRVRKVIWGDVSVTLVDF